LAEDPRCCELARLVYDFPGPCRRRVYEELREVYSASRTCEERHDDEETSPLLALPIGVTKLAGFCCH